MPYIDLANEILEYFVAHGDLSADAVHDTGEATTDELLAEPQFVIPLAYDRLKAARYPLSLPFDLWLETVRGFFDHFETPLWRVMETFRPSEALFDSGQAYDWAAIFAESLGIGSDEYAVLTSAQQHAAWFALYGFDRPTQALTKAVDPETQQRIDLVSAKALARRLSVSYTELVELVRSRFVNPKLDALVTLHKLHIDVDTALRYKKRSLSADEQQTFEQRLQQLTTQFNPTLDPNGFNAQNWLDTTVETADFNQILILADEDASCNFDKTELQRADGTPAQPLDFLRINLFVRLWRRLGWSIEETDRALAVFQPAAIETLSMSNVGQVMQTVLVCLAHLKTLSERLRVGKDSRLKLLTLWSELPTTGKKPLYAQLFLRPSILHSDAVFDDPLGEYLTNPEEPLLPHLLAVQAALNLVAQDIEAILADSGETLADVKLTLATVSRLYRYGLLAKALKLSVRELIELKHLSGLDPFQPLHPEPLGTLDQDHPFTQTLRFVDLAEQVKDSGFTIEDLAYLLRHRFDPVGKYRPAADIPLALVQSLATELARIRSEHAIPRDPLELSDDVLQQKLALVLPPDVTETCMAMWNGTQVYEVTVDSVPVGAQLDPGAFADIAGLSLSYDAVTESQTLAYTGVLLPDRKQEILALSASPLLAKLLGTVEEQATVFFDTYLKKSTIGDHPIGFLEPEDLSLLFTPLPPLPKEEETLPPEEALTPEERKQMRVAREEKDKEKRKRLAEAFLPFLQHRLISSHIVQTLAADLGAEPALVEALLADVLTDPSQAQAKLLDTMAAAGEVGVTAQFFGSVDATGTPLATLATSQVSTVPDNTARPIKPEGAQSVRFDGYLTLPASGPYRFFAHTSSPTADMVLRFDHLPDPLLQGTPPPETDELSDFLELKAGVPYRFSFEVHNLASGDTTLQFQAAGLPKGSLARLRLYPDAAVERVHRAHILLGKALQVIQTLALNEREIRHLHTHSNDFEGFNLSLLPTRVADDSASGAVALFGQLRRVLDYTRLKQDMGGAETELIDVFEHARRTFPARADDTVEAPALFEAVSARIGALTRRDAAQVRSVAEQLGFQLQTTLTPDGFTLEAPDFVSERGIARLWAALQIVERLGAPVTKIAQWATPEPDFNTARDLKDTVKARYDTEGWQRTAQPIFDQLRQRQRDALADHVMARLGFERIEQLYEYFLIDPGMEPVVQTSRLRLAISSVQLFVQRCLLNLEKEVAPSMINSEHWQWMKRYRVWEANRKIFLFPENWLEPEFRDDKSHLCQELEGALLQGDVSRDLVEDAFFAYLTKLQELAHLDIVTMTIEEKPDPSHNVLHVIGRTFNNPHKYFYRRYAHRMWTPWEPVGVDIESDHLAAVVWRDRLHLFWVTWMQEPQKQDPSPQGDTGNIAEMTPNALIRAAPPPRIIEKAQLNWCEYFQGTWTTRESGGFDVPIAVRVREDFKRGEVFIHVSKEFDNGEERGVRIHLHFDVEWYGTSSLPVDKAFLLSSKNSPPMIESGEKPPTSAYPGVAPRATHYQRGKGHLQVHLGNAKDRRSSQVDVLKENRSYSLLLVDDNPPTHSFLTRKFNPLFYADGENTFFVEPYFLDLPMSSWGDWAVPTDKPSANLATAEQATQVAVAAAKPPPRYSPVDAFVPDALASFDIQEKKDWLTHSGTVLGFGQGMVGRTGGMDPVVVAVRSGALGSSTAYNVVGGGGLTRTLPDDAQQPSGPNLELSQFGSR